MSIVNFISEKWSALVELIAQEMSIAVRVTGGQYQADATGTKAIKANRIVAGTIGDYTGADINIEALSDEQVEILIDQKKYFAFSVDDVDVAQSMANYRDAAMVQYATQLALEADKYTFGLFGDASIPTGNKIGTLAAPVAITDLNVDTEIFNAKEILDSQNAGPDRWLIVPPWFMNKLVSAGLGVQLAENTKDDMWKTAEVLVFAGFNIVMSNSLTVDSTADGYQILAYTSRAIALVDQVQKVDAQTMEKRFADLVKGLYVFGAKVIHGKEVVVISAIKG